MLKLNLEILDQVRAASQPQDLFGIMQGAIELEHSTIPPYLTAMFSLKPGRNREIWGIIHSVVLEEMLHMTIAANILIALGGDPDFIHEKFVPEYPGPLPMNVACKGSTDKGCLQVGLSGFSKQQVHDVFMAIEQPESPLNYQVKEGAPRPMLKAAANEEATQYATIGEFYEAIKTKLIEMGLDRLPGADRPQVIPNQYYSEEECFPIRTLGDAIRAIDIIVEQGEGTGNGTEGGSPLDPEGHLAHYYRFAELYYGRRLVKDPTSPGGYSYSGPVFPFEVDGLWNLVPNTKTADLPKGSAQRIQADQFNFVYRKLLLTLHKAFNGEPSKFDATIGLMYDLKLVGEKLTSMPFPGQVGLNCGPPFEYVTLNL